MVIELSNKPIKNILIKKILFFLESLIYKNASAIVTLSSDMRRSIVSRYPKLDNKPIDVIDNISDIDRFQKGYDKNVSALSKKIGFKPKFTILYAGTFGKVNGINYVVNLANKLIDINQLKCLRDFSLGMEILLLFIQDILDI